MTAYFRLKDSATIISTDNPQYWKDCERVPVKEGARLMQEQACNELRAMLQPGSTVYAVLRHVSSSGMSRRIDFFTMQDNKPRYITGYIAEATHYRLHSKGGLDVGGCGMDMAFSVVYNLGATLWPNGTDKPHGTRNGEPDNTGGYALKSEWI